MLSAPPCHVSQPAIHPASQPAGQIQPPSNNNMLHLVPASPAHQAQAPRPAEDLRGRGGGQAQGTRRLADGGAPRPKPGVERAFWFGTEAKAERAEGNLEREGQLVRRVYIEISILEVLVDYHCLPYHRTGSSSSSSSYCKEHHSTFDLIWSGIHGRLD